MVVSSLAATALLATALALLAASPAAAFSFPGRSTKRTTTRSTTTSVVVFVSNFNEGDSKKTMDEEGGEESEEDFQRRMAVVRSLQMSFYGKDASKDETQQQQQQQQQEGVPNGGTAGKEEDATSDDTTASATNVRSRSPPSSLGPPSLDPHTGTIHNLPLFRAAWYELPGRSNVLILRDPIYTNMFERMFYTRKNGVLGSSLTPWVFGHLYTPNNDDAGGDGGEEENTGDHRARASKKSEKRGACGDNTLSAWNETKATATGDDSLSSPAALGTLMYVRDYRRLKDGRILALVQAAEKFVVEEVLQTLPYSIVDATVLPDVEELKLELRENTTQNAGAGSTSSSTSSNNNNNDAVSSVYSCDESDRDERYLVAGLRADEGASAAPARVRAVSESVFSYHHYECDPHQKLDGIPHKSDLGIIDITHDAISRALPYCRFSNATMAAATRTTSQTTSEAAAAREDSREPPPSSGSPSLEFRLLRKGITRIPPSDRRFSYNKEPTYPASNGDGQNNGKNENESPSAVSRPWTTEELEYELWLVLDYFSSVTNKPLSPILLALLPSEGQMPKAWPPGFRLKELVEKEQQLLHKDDTTSSASGFEYPHQRRQRRLSYSAAYLLEAIVPIGSGSDTGGRYSDNFRSGGRRCAPESTGKSTGTFEVDEVQELRARLLSVPSTRQRLRVVLEEFHRWRLYRECDEFA